MREEEENIETQDYLEYKKSKNEIKEEKTSNFKFLSWLFIVTFSGIFIVIVIFINAHFSQIDIEKDDNLRNMENSTTNSFIDQEKQFSIDKRLQEIFQEETAPSAAKSTKVKDEVIEKEEFDTLKADNTPEQKSEPSIIKTNKLSPESSATNIVPQPGVATRVLIGRYDTIEEAELARAKIADTQNIESPFVKKIGDIFTIQIGVYTDNNAAMMLANKFSNLGYNVWLIKD